MSSSQLYSVYLPTSIYLSQNWDQSWIKLQNTITDTFIKVNQRQIGFYYTNETPTGQQWSSLNTEVQKFTFRKIYTFGAIAPNTNLQIPLNITRFTTLTFTNIYGTCKTDVPDDRPLPYVDATSVTNQIGLRVVNNNIQIINGATGSNILSGIVVLEYLKN